MEATERAERFAELERVFGEWHLEVARTGAAHARPTCQGLWAPSTARDVFALLEAVGAEGCQHFADLGSGDGLVTCIASLFCPATGLECDPALVEKARELRDQLNLSAEFICGDFLKADLSPYDLLYIYPDKPLYYLERELAPRLRGRLIVYSVHFPLKILPRLEVVQLGTCQAAVYGPVVDGPPPAP
jgi:hypothetical protein